MKNYRIEETGQYFPTEIVGDNSGSVLDIAYQDVVQNFENAGALVFSGFKCDIEEFYRFNTQFAAKILRDPFEDRIPHKVSDEIQSVTIGTGGLELHAEFGHTPFRPDVISFFCETPASEGGATTICDSAAILMELERSVLDVFLSKKIRYEFGISERVWQKFFLTNDMSAVQKYLKTMGVDAHADRYRTLCAAWETPAVFKSRFSGLNSIASNLFERTYPGLRITFADGEEISPEVLSEFGRAAKLHTVELKLNSGQMVMLDNTRFLHGRREFLDPLRKLFAIQYMARS
ncbi:hypothetical protein B9Z45_15790 [Limnohabitans sp. 2KL-17]|uniref:TauD/TfdA family dioxygenase n=1 Tax=Limnohabitans sp. 2KL-17 TaxID=1100704 RepID=UPI000D343FB0|nr:TauD/TfdA family dioxygenase [Limnohabitans sp. 2KL-17]PUE48553.1 hypothetical protein B9Z45_15790 [Limnohabitans sp. 2KL-17]